MSLKSARTPGRPRSETSHQSILDATSRLMERQPIRLMTISGIAKEANVGKPTIYRWWDSKCALVMEAFLAKMEPQVPMPKAKSTREALGQHVKSMIKMLNGTAGRIVAEIIGEGQADPHILEEFRTRLFAPLTEPARAIIRQGKASGELAGDVDVDLVVDLIYGPIYHRLLVGHHHLDRKFTVAMQNQVTSILMPVSAVRGLQNDLMSEKPIQTHKPDIPQAAQTDRQERLNAALRANLKKRKQQSRARGETSTGKTGEKAAGTD